MKENETGDTQYSDGVYRSLGVVIGLEHSRRAILMKAVVVVVLTLACLALSGAARATDGIVVDGGQFLNRRISVTHGKTDDLLGSFDVYCDGATPLVVEIEAECTLFFDHKTGKESSLRLAFTGGTVAPGAKSLYNGVTVLAQYASGQGIQVPYVVRSLVVLNFSSSGNRTVSFWANSTGTTGDAQYAVNQLECRRITYHVVK